MRYFALSALLCAGLAVISADMAFAQRRVALVIGNSNYAHTSPLPNPSNDARAVAAALKRLDFQVVLALDVTQNEIAQPLSEFSQLLNGADVGLLFYAGHGLSFEGQNYLVPVDASAVSAIHVKFQMTPIDRIAEEMARSVRLNIIILDACRNNPLAVELARSLGGQSRSADVSRGLSAMKPVGRESFILFATAPGSVAADGRGIHSPFTDALLAHMEQPGLSIEDVFRNVRRDVREATANQQFPEMWLRLENRFQFNEGPAAAGAPPSAATHETPSETIGYNAEHDHVYWESIRNLGDIELFKIYIKEFPSGRYVAIAERMIATLSKPKDESQTSSIASGPSRTQNSGDPVSPSFNCQENTGEIEQLICRDQSLAKLDVTMSELYFRVHGRSSQEEGQRLQKDQREWLKARNACKADAGCVQGAYERRIDQLQAAANRRN